MCGRARLSSDATPPGEGLAERRLRVDGLGLGVDVGEADLYVLRPETHEPPAQHVEAALPGPRVVADDRQVFGGCRVPIGRDIGGRPLGRDRKDQLDLALLVPFDCFYEWKKLGKERQPYAVALADRRLMALAGLWETWRSPAGERVRSFAIVTTAPNALLAALHDRMPVILAPESWPTWLGERATDPEQLKSLLKPYPADDMVIWAVDRRVGNANNKDPALIEPAAAATG